jgi:hypothetical protein
MRVIKSYIKFNESLENRELFYHGSPYVFENFKGDVGYFTRDRKFAIEYSDQKSMDAGIDNHTNIYEVEIPKIDHIFNLENKDHYKKLYDILPDQVEWSYNNFGFTTKTPKEDILYNMKGFDIIEPLDEVLNSNVGDTFPNPEYAREKYIVLKKDDNFAYCILEDRYERFTNSIMNYAYKSSIMTNSKLLDIFEESINYIKEYFNVVREERDSYVHDWLKAEYLNKFMGNRYTYTETFEIPEKNMKEFKAIYNKNLESAKELIIKEYSTAFTLVEKKVELSETWRYFENNHIHDALVKLGFIGYSAKEDGIITYAIFNPNENVNIVKYNLPMPFDNFEEYRKFNKYRNEVYAYLKEIKSDARTWGSEIYDAFKDNIDKKEYEEYVKENQ